VSLSLYPRYTTLDRIKTVSGWEADGN
jgi:hypothetical protein